MKTNIFFKRFMPLAAAFILAATAPAQDARPGEVPPPEDKRPAADRPHDIRADKLRHLGLSPEQIQQMRGLTLENWPLIHAAQKRFREAKRSLDEAIYADHLNEADIETRLKEVQLAQAEVGRLRYMNELAVRRILTQEQLVRFREARQRFEKERIDYEKRRRTKVDRQRPGKVKNPSADGQPQSKTFAQRLFYRIHSGAMPALVSKVDTFNLSVSLLPTRGLAPVFAV